MLYFNHSEYSLRTAEKGKGSMKGLQSTGAIIRDMQEKQNHVPDESIVQTKGSSDTSTGSLSVDPMVVVFGLLAAFFFWALNHLTGGALTIFPGHPELDPIITGAVIGVYFMYRRLKKEQDLQDIKEIQDHLADRKKQEN